MLLACRDSAAHLGDVVEVPEDAVLFGLQLGFEVGPDDWNVVDHQLQATGRQC